MALGPISVEGEVERLRRAIEMQQSIAEGASNYLAFIRESQPHGSELSTQVREELSSAKLMQAQLNEELNNLLSGPNKSIEEIAVTSKGEDVGGLADKSNRSEPRQNATSVSLRDLLLRLAEIKEIYQKLAVMDAAVALMIIEPDLVNNLRFEEIVPCVLECLADNVNTYVRAGAYRLLRHLISYETDFHLLHSCHLDLYLTRTFARDYRADIEKGQALRFVRLLLEEPKLHEHVSSAVIRAISAVAECSEEKLQISCLQLLAELVIRNIKLLVAADGIRVILSALIDGPCDLAPSLASALMWAMDRPLTRQNLRPGVDIEVVLAGFTDVQGRTNLQEERARNSAVIVSKMLQTWTGFLYFNLNSRQALRAIVGSLQTPSVVIRKILLDLLFEIFGLPIAQGNCRGSESRSAAPIPRRPPKFPNLRDQYLSVLLASSVECGLLEVLGVVASSTWHEGTSPQVCLLIGEILQLSTRIMPLPFATSAQALPRLFQFASSFDVTEARLAATTALAAVDDLNRVRARLHLDVEEEDLQARSSGTPEDALRRGQRQVENAKKTMAMLMDDNSFRYLLLETQILSSKDHTRWVVDEAIRLLEGPLMNPRRLDEAMKATKFVRRLLSFYHPFNYRYSDLRKSNENTKYTTLACALIKTLLANPDGVRFLMEDKLMRQIAECISQLDPMEGPPTSEIVFSKTRAHTTQVLGYFEMIGFMTHSNEGIMILNHFKIFTVLYRIMDLLNREDLVEAMLAVFDYSQDGHARVLLSKALTSGNKSIRSFATRFLSRLSKIESSFPEWQIRLLLVQMYDPVAEVSDVAASTLENACQSLHTLELVVQMRPSLDHVPSVGNVLMTRFLSTPVGLEYLHETGFIERQLDDWFNINNTLYAIKLEVYLAENLSLSKDDTQRFDGIPPPHFYGELVKTEQGCNLLAESEHFPEFVAFIRQHCAEQNDYDVLIKLKGILWAVGSIGASANGLVFLEDSNIIGDIVSLTEKTEVFSLRGTAFHILGLIASTLEGSEILYDFGWNGVTTQLATATGICLPTRIANLVESPSWKIEITPDVQDNSTKLFTHHLERKVIRAVADLSNHILAKKASKALSQLKIGHPELFSSLPVIYRCLALLSSHPYRLLARRFVFELFDIRLNQQAIQQLYSLGRDLEHDKEAPSPSYPDVSLAQFKDVIDLDHSNVSSSPDDQKILPQPATILNPLLNIRGFVVT